METCGPRAELIRAAVKRLGSVPHKQLRHHHRERHAANTSLSRCNQATCKQSLLWSYCHHDFIVKARVTSVDLFFSWVDVEIVDVYKGGVEDDEETYVTNGTSVELRLRHDDECHCPGARAVIANLDEGEPLIVSGTHVNELFVVNNSLFEEFSERKAANIRGFYAELCPVIAHWDEGVSPALLSAAHIQIRPLGNRTRWINRNN